MQTVDSNTGKQTAASKRRSLLRKKFLKRIGVVQNGREVPSMKRPPQVHFEIEDPLIKAGEVRRNSIPSVRHKKDVQDNLNFEQKSEDRAVQHHHHHKPRKKIHVESAIDVPFTGYSANKSHRLHVKSLDDNISVHSSIGGKDSTHSLEPVRLSKHVVLPAIHKGNNIEPSNSAVTEQVDDTATDQTRVFHSRLSFSAKDQVRENDVIAVSSRVSRKRHRRRSFSDVTPEGDKGYVPSWNTTGLRDMDRRSRMSKGSAASSNQAPGMKKSWSVSDLREVDHSKIAGLDLAAYNKGQEVHKAKNHSRIEEEYLRLRKQINNHSEPSDATILNSTMSSIRNSSVDSPASTLDLLLDQKVSMLESDELGINHFKKHIQNVKQTSKKFRRSLKNAENAQKQNRRKLPTRYIPIYER